MCQVRRPPKLEKHWILRSNKVMFLLRYRLLTRPHILGEGGLSSLKVLGTLYFPHRLHLVPRFWVLILW